VAPILPFGSFAPINPAHPANIGLRFAWVANGSIAAYDAVIPGRGAVNGAPKVAFDKKLGPCVAFGGTSDYFTFAHRTTANDKNVTIAVIATITGTTGNDQVFFTTDSSGTGGWRLRYTSSGTLNLVKNSIAGIDMGTGPVGNVPYLLVASNNSTSGATNFLMKRLDTGVVTTGTASDTNSPGAPNGSYALGSNAGSAGADSNIGAVLFNAQYMTMAQLQAWAADPWGPWFNDIAASVFATWVGKVSSGVAVVADAAGFLEFLAAQRSDPPVLFEWSALQRRDGTAPAESLALQRGDEALPSEDLGGVRADMVASLELQLTVRGDPGVLIQFAALVRADAIAQLESLLALRRDDPAAPEFQLALRCEGILQDEWALGLVRSDTVAVIETLFGLRSDAPKCLELLGLVRGETAAQAEWLGALLVILDAKTPIEWSSLVERDAPSGMEALGSVQTDTVTAGEWQSRVTIDPGVVLECLGKLLVVSDAPATLEWQARLFVDEILAAEWSGTVASDQPITLEWSAPAVRILHATLVALAKKRLRTATAQPRRRIATWSRNEGLVQLLWPPIDAAGEEEFVGFDFGPALAPGVTVSGNPAVSCTVYSGSAGDDPTPGDRLLASPAIVPSAATGAASAQVDVLIGQMVGGAMYLLQCAAATSDEQVLVITARLTCIAPT
jgi:hypothetical protein